MSADSSTGLAIGARHPRLERILFLYAPLAFALLFLVGPFYWMLITRTR